MSLRVSTRETPEKIVMTCKIFLEMVRWAALGMGADTGLWLRRVQYERTTRAAGNAHIIKST